MNKRWLTVGLVLSAFFTIASLRLAAQTSWQKIAPVGESFSVLMPVKAKDSTRLIPLTENDWIPGRFYSSTAGGKRYIVLTFLKTTPERALPLSSLDKFLSGMEEAFKTREKELPKSLTFDREVSVDNYTARQYRVVVGDYSGVARLLGTENAFYALMVIGAEESDPAATRFLTSFRLGEPNSNSELSGVITSVQSSDEPADSLPPEPWPRSSRPITGGVLNGKAISLPKPKYPKEARDAHDSGLVEVAIVIDEQGNVIKAEAIIGPMSLRDACVAAALRARFTPTRLMGQPVKVSGRITYNFVAN